jgi:hypothetical protein
VELNGGDASGGAPAIDATTAMLHLVVLETWPNFNSNYANDESSGQWPWHDGAPAVLGHDVLSEARYDFTHVRGT